MTTQSCRGNIGQPAAKYSECAVSCISDLLLLVLAKPKDETVAYPIRWQLCSEQLYFSVKNTLHADGLDFRDSEGNSAEDFLR